MASVRVRVKVTVGYADDVQDDGVTANPQKGKGITALDELNLAVSGDVSGNSAAIQAKIDTVKATLAARLDELNVA